jgi:hypothetical protein
LIFTQYRLMDTLPIVAKTFIRNSTLPILLGVLTSLYDELEIDLEIWPVIKGQILVADPQSKTRVTEKHLIFTGQKISLLALHTASLELDHILPVKSRKIDLKIDFFLKIYYKKKSWVLKWPEKILYKIAWTHWNRYLLLKFLISNRLMNYLPIVFLWYYYVEIKSYEPRKKSGWPIEPP